MKINDIEVSIKTKEKFLAQHQTQVVRQCISPKSLPYDTNTTTHRSNLKTYINF